MHNCTAGTCPPPPPPQAQDVMAPDADRRHASASVHIQVKLTEALDHCDTLSPPRAAEDGQLQPDRLRTAVCCKVGTAAGMQPVLQLAAASCSSGSNFWSVCPSLHSQLQSQ